jgi:hypothetical protein
MVKNVLDTPRVRFACSAHYASSALQIPIRCVTAAALKTDDAYGVRVRLD